MNSKEYILKQLGILITKFPNVHVRYEYDKYALVHFIEVVPNNVYHFDSKYIAWESNLDDKFVEFFPTENICFISDDAPVGIENAELILYGKNFIPVSTEKEAIIIGQEAVVKQEKSLIDLMNQITFLDSCNNNNIIDNLTISGVYPNSYNQYKYSLAA
jgi:hypothetical protein